MNGVTGEGRVPKGHWTGVGTDLLLHSKYTSDLSDGQQSSLASGLVLGSLDECPCRVDSRPFVEARPGPDGVHSVTSRPLRPSVSTPETSGQGGWVPVDVSIEGSRETPVRTSTTLEARGESVQRVMKRSLVDVSYPSVPPFTFDVW